MLTSFFALFIALSSASTIDTFLQQLNSSDECQSTLIFIANNFLHSPQLNAALANSGKNFNDLGMYHSCKNSTHNYYMVFDISMIYVPFITLGLCVPNECPPESFDPFKQTIADLIKEKLAYDIGINGSDVHFFNETQSNQQYKKMSAGRAVGITILAIIIFITIVGTFTEYYKAKGTLAKFCSCFSVIQNGRALMFSQNKVDRNLDVLNGVRVLSICWVVLGHCYSWYMFSPVLNAEDETSIMSKSMWFSLVSSGTLAVDTFFALSGFLAGFGMTKSFENKKNRNIKVILMNILKRLLRLYPIYGALFLMAYCIAPYLGSGPIFFKVEDILTYNCDKYWWKNLLFINNIWNSDKMCFSWTWYLGADMQFYIMGLILSLVYSINKLNGFLLNILLMLASGSINLFIVLHYKLSMSVTKNLLEYADSMNKLYWNSYNRYTTYGIGVAFAWSYLAFKDRNYQFRLSDNFNKFFTNTIIRRTIYIVSLAVTTFVVFIYGDFNLYPDNITKAENAIFCVFQRPIFTLAMMLIIYPIMLGYNRPLLMILGHEFFNFVSKMTYSIYLFHIIVYTVYFNSSLQGLEFSGVFMVTRAGDVFVVTCFVAFVMTLLFDSPMIQLQKHFIFPQRAIKVPTSEENINPKSTAL